MSGLLSGVLPAVFSQADRAKRFLGGLLSDPVGRVEQSMGQAQADLSKMGLLSEQAFSDPRNPMKMQDNAASRQLVDTYLNSVMNFAPAGIVTGGPMAAQLNQKYGDLLDATLMEGRNVNLSKVVVPKDARGQGVGSDFMNDLVALADQQGQRVTLTPSADFGGNKARLEQFYKRFGFVPNKGRNKDYEVFEAMYRDPK